MWLQGVAATHSDSPARLHSKLPLAKGTGQGGGSVAVALAAQFSWFQDTGSVLTVSLPWFLHRLSDSGTWPSHMLSATGQRALSLLGQASSGSSALLCGYGGSAGTHMGQSASESATTYAQPSPY